jgi:hypothetical protein
MTDEDKGQMDQKSFMQKHKNELLKARSMIPQECVEQT